MLKTDRLLILFLILLNLFFVECFAEKKHNKTNISNQEYLKAIPQKGEVLQNFFKRYNLEFNKKSKEFFIEKNEGKLYKDLGLKINVKYIMPIKLIKYKANLSNSTKIKSKETIEYIEYYNTFVVENKLKNADYTEDNIIWVPVFIPKNINTIDKKIPDEESYNTKLYPIFGEKYQEVKPISKKLKGCVFYLISGHGGPDPGAVGSRNGYEMHEDEYAYDVMLRLARKLLEQSAVVNIIVQDEDDGIRDMQYLNNDSHELLLDGSEISEVQKVRLRQRTDIINKLYGRNKENFHHQYVVEIHVDSRVNQKGIDIFFYHNPDNRIGEKLATSMLNTINDKYEKAQPGRGYTGSVTSRNLFTLRESKPTGVYIELGNIQNTRDQIRLIEPNNRQAIANWLCDGLINGLKK